MLITLKTLPLAGILLLTGCGTTQSAEMTPNVAACMQLTEGLAPYIPGIGDPNASSFERGQTYTSISEVYSTLAAGTSGELRLALDKAARSYLLAGDALRRGDIDAYLDIAVDVAGDGSDASFACTDVLMDSVSR